MEDPSGFKVLELGAGCGLTGLVSARLLENIRQSVATLASARVILTDFNSTVIENLNRNVALNDLNDICSVVGLDFYCVESRENGKWCDMDGVSHPPVDVIIGADIICQASDAAAVATTLSAVLKKNGVAFIVCADAAHRFGVEHLTRQCQEVGLLVYTQNAGEFLDSSQTKNLEQTTGYVEDMHLTLFVVHKRGTI